MEIGFTNGVSEHTVLECDRRDARVCTACHATWEDEILDARGRCEDCVDLAADEARVRRARELAVRAAAETLGFRAHRVLRAVVEHCEFGPTYLSVHGELSTLKFLAKLGLVRCVAEWVSRSPMASSRAWVATEDGKAIVAYRKVTTHRTSNVRAVA